MRIDFASKPVAIPLGLIWVVALAAGLVGVTQRLLTGHELTNYTSSIPWGLWVAAYVYFVRLSAGPFLPSALIHVLGLQRLEPLGKRALFTALVSLIAALLLIWLDIGRMERFYYVFTRGNTLSMMAWMVWLYTAYFVVLSVEFWFAMRGDLVAMSQEQDLRGRFASLLLGRFREALGERRLLPLTDPHDSEKDMRMVR